MLTDDEIDGLARYWRGIKTTEFQSLCAQAKEANRLRASDESLHTAICIAVGMMNMGDNAPARIVLKKALVSFADAALQGKEKA